MLTRLTQIDKYLTSKPYLDTWLPGIKSTYYKFVPLHIKYNRFVKKYAKYVRSVEFNFPALSCVSDAVAVPRFPRGALFKLNSVRVVYGGGLRDRVSPRLAPLFDMCIDRPLRSLTICTQDGAISCRTSVQWGDIRRLLHRATTTARQLTTLQLCWDFSYVHAQDQVFLIDSLRKMKNLATLYLKEGSILKALVADLLHEKGVALKVVEGAEEDDEHGAVHAVDGEGEGADAGENRAQRTREECS